MPHRLFTEWLELQDDSDALENVTVFSENQDYRAEIAPVLRETLLDHFVGLDLIEQIGGFPKATATIRNSLPDRIATRSGDFGEILGTEYVDQCTQFTVPIRRLRHKDDRNMPMRGDDILGFDFSLEPLRVLKGEAKSRIRLSSTVVREASDGLKSHKGRPNPSSLSFVSRHLRDQERNDYAESGPQNQSNDNSSLNDQTSKTFAHLITNDFCS